MSKKIVSKSLGFTILSLAASLLNFGFYPVVAYLLSKAAFGDVQVGVSFIMLAAALFTSLSTLALFFAARENNNQTMEHLERLVIALSVIASILVVLAAQPISSALQLQDASLLYILAFIFIINIPASTWVGTLQGQGQFIESGWISTVAAFIKIVAALIFIQLGWGAHGALAGIAVGTLSMLPLVKVLQKRKLASFRRTFSMINNQDISFFVNNPRIVITLVSLIIFSIIGTLDVLWAKHSLLPHDAGVFAQLSTIAKIPYFAMVPIAIIIFERLTKGTVPIIKTGTVYALICLTVGAATLLLNDRLAELLFHIDMPGKALSLLIIGFTSYALFTMQIYLLIAQRDTIRLFVSSLTALLLVQLGLIFSEKSPESIALTYVTMLSISLLISVALRYTKRHENS